MRTNSASTPAFENAVNVQIGEPEEAKLARSLRNAGMFGAAGAVVGGIAGAGLNSAAFEASEQAKPVYNRRLTEAQHARDNASLAIESGEDPLDYAIYEGIRQGLIGGAITPQDVNRMLIEEDFSERARLLIGDIHDSSGPELQTNPRLIAQLIEEDGGDGAAYLMRQQQLRDELGINVPV